MDEARRVLFVDEEEGALYDAAKNALLALAKKKGVDSLSALWWLYAAPMEMKKATYASYYGHKEVWSVVLELPERFRQAAAIVPAATPQYDPDPPTPG